MSRIRLSDTQVLIETAADVMFEMEPDWSVDELLLHPGEAMKLCAAVRRKLSKQTPDSDILRALLNGRKQGLLPARSNGS